MQFVTPHDWNLPGRNVIGIRGRDAYLARLGEIEKSLRAADEWLYTWGYHQYFHGEIST